MTVTVLRGANVRRLRPGWHRSRAALKDAGAPLRGGPRAILDRRPPPMPRSTQVVTFSPSFLHSECESAHVMP